MDECFGMHENRCVVLTKTKCEDCSFYKTRERHIIDRIAAIERLKSLPDDVQLYIREKYGVQRESD